MAKQPSNLKIYIDLPLSIGLSTVAAITNAFDVKLVPAKQNTNPATYSAQNADGLVIVDLCKLSAHGLNIRSLAERTPAPQRKKYLLTNLTGCVNKSESQYAKQLGFADLVSDLDPRNSASGIKVLNQWIERELEISEISSNRLDTYLKTVPIPSAQEPSRSLIQRCTGQSPEALSLLMDDELDIRNRSYRLKVYPNCFLGNEAVQWLMHKFKLSADKAVAVGGAMTEIGLIFHAAYEQAFDDKDNYYGLNVSAAADKCALSDIVDLLKSPKGAQVKERTHLGTNYSKCFVGSQVVDLLTEHWSLNRKDAAVVLHRLERLQIFEHVTQERPFIDGNYFYRFR
jgi:Domain found in Dishevelled, Egl-10, and Pleckstrin (DEP)